MRRVLAALVTGRSLAEPGPPRSTSAILRDAMRSANAAHGYPLVMRDADATAAAVLRRALRHGA